MRQLSPALSLISVFSLLLSGCGTVPSSQVDIEPLPSVSQEAVYTRGLPMLRSIGESATVIVSPIETPRRQAYRNSFWVWVENRSLERSFNFEIDDVTVRYNSANSKVLSYTEAKNEAYAEMRDRKVLAALAYSSQTLSADQTATSQVGTIGGPSVQIYEPSKAQQIRVQAANELESDRLESESKFQARVEGLESYIRRDTISPGESFGGYFYFNINNFQYGKSNDLTITVNAGGEAHKFRFREFNHGLSPSELNTAAPSKEPQPDEKGEAGNIFEGNFFNGRKLWGS